MWKSSTHAKRQMQSVYTTWPKTLQWTLPIIDSEEFKIQQQGGYEYRSSGMPFLHCKGLTICSCEPHKGKVDLKNKTYRYHPT